jgi:hypothetical protein
MEEPCALDGNLLCMLDGIGDRERHERGKLGWIRFLGAKRDKGHSFASGYPTHSHTSDENRILLLSRTWKTPRST